MEQYRFADLLIEMNCRYDLLRRRSEKYRVREEEESDLILDIPEESMTQPEKKMAHLSPEEIEFILMGSRFFGEFLNWDGFVIHASAIAFRNRGVLFSADSGTGKSTHTRLWQKHFGPDKAPIINDDKPAIRFMDGRYYVYGTPFSGNSEENRNMKVPLHAIVFLQRAENNSIERLDTPRILPLMLRQTLRPGASAERMDLFLAQLNRLLPVTPCYLLRCNMDEEVVDLVAGTLFPEESVIRQLND